MNQVKLILLLITSFLKLSGQTSGLVAHYPFTQGSLIDSEGNFNGTSNQIISTPDRFYIQNDALSFSPSTGNYVNIGDVLDDVFSGSDKKFSLSIWMRPASIMNNNLFFSKYAHNSCFQDQRQFFARIYNGRINFTFYFNLSDIPLRVRAVSGSTLITDVNCWYHIVINYDGSNDSQNGLNRVQIYVNGAREELEMIISNGELGDILASTSPLCIGSALSIEGQLCGNFTFNGALDDIRIYNKVLTEQEITNIYHIGQYRIPTEINASICMGESFAGYTEEGVYLEQLLTQQGCDSSRVINLSVLPNTEYAETISICQGQTYQGYSSSGTYTTHYNSANGCDSTYVLNLTVQPYVTLDIESTICEGGDYLGYNLPGIYVDTLYSTNGCDTIRRLSLNLLENIAISQTAVLCPGEAYAGYNLPGTYQFINAGNNGNCDTITILTIELSPTHYSSQTISICDTYIANKFIQPGIYLDTMSNIFGCDSIVRRNVIEDKVYIPNIFSPNDDGINDYFIVYTNPETASNIKIKSIKIFNRWGGLVFDGETFPFNTPIWDGRAKNQILNPDIYTYYLYYSCGDSLKELKGSIQLVR